MSKSLGYPKGKSRGFKKSNNLTKGKNTKKDMEQNKQIMKIEKKIKMIQKEPELKWTDEYNPAIIVPNTGLVFNVFTPGPIIGTGPNNRIGNSIIMTSLMTKILLLNNANNLDPTRYRILMVVDKEFETGNPVLGGAPLSNSILDNSFIPDLTLSPRNFNNVNRYNILYDKVFVLNVQAVLDYAITTGTTEQYSRVGKFVNINLKRKHKVQFLGPTNTPAELSGQIPLLYIVSDRPATLEPLTTVAQRVYYKDS